MRIKFMDKNKTVIKMKLFWNSPSESDPYTGSSADGGNTDDNAYDPTYGRVGAAHRQYPNQQFGAKRSTASMPWAYNSREGTYYGEWDE